MLQNMCISLTDGKNWIIELYETNTILMLVCEMYYIYIKCVLKVWGCVFLFSNFY